MARIHLMAWGQAGQPNLKVKDKTQTSLQVTTNCSLLQMDFQIKPDVG